MSTYFVDSSALGRRYLNEIGSVWTLAWIPKATGNVVIVSDLASVEMFSTFERLKRDGMLTALATLKAQTNLLLDVQLEYLSIPLDEITLTSARSLTTQHQLRALDAIQLASAVRATTLFGERLIFVSGDNRLLVAAMAEGFVTDNPYLHP